MAQFLIIVENRFFANLIIITIIWNIHMEYCSLPSDKFYRYVSQSNNCFILLGKTRFEVF